MKRYARSSPNIKDRWLLRSKRDRNKLLGLNSLNLLETYIIWYRPRRSQVFTIHPTSMLSLRPSMLRLNNTLRVPSRWITSGNHLTRIRSSFSERSQLSSKRPWNNRKYSMEKLSLSEEVRGDHTTYEWIQTFAWLYNFKRLFLTTSINVAISLYIIKKKACLFLWWVLFSINYFPNATYLFKVYNNSMYHLE